jgi:GntR family transcriptional regulator
MAPFTVDAASSVPLVHQVARRIRGQIARGELRVGSYLPSVRELGGELKINFNTVAKSYRILEREGLIEIRHGLGARVRDNTVHETSKPNPDFLLDDLEDVINQLALTGASQEQVVDFFAEAIGRHYKDLNADRA